MGSVKRSIGDTYLYLFLFIFVVALHWFSPLSACGSLIHFVGTPTPTPPFASHHITPLRGPCIPHSSVNLSICQSVSQRRVMP